VSERRVPSPATVLSVIALMVALGGSAYAALAVTGKDVENGSLTGRDVKKNSLGGKQIAEAKLGSVPNAADAEHADVAGRSDTAGSAQSAQSAASAEALAGYEFATIDATQAIDNPGDIQPIFELGGLRLQLGCASGVGTPLFANTSTDNARIRVAVARGNDDVVVVNNVDFDTGEPLNITDVNAIVGVIDVVYRRPSGSGNQVVTATLSVETGPGNFCHAYGHAMADSP